MSNSAPDRYNIAPPPARPSSLFAVSNKVVEVCRNLRTQAADLYRVICLDPVLFSETQSLYNHFYPAAKDRYTSIAKIIITLNLNTVKNWALEFADNARLLIETKKARAPEIAVQKKCWRHTHGVAIATRLLAKENGVPPEKLEEYYAAGLSHDIDEYMRDGFKSAKKLSAAVAEAHLYADNKIMRKLVEDELKSSEIFLGIRGA
jgi:HD-like signal output (HDOD) protein